MNTPDIPPKIGRRLRWYQGLQFKLGILFIGLVVVLGTVAFFAGFKLVGNGLSIGNFRYEESISHRLVAQVQLPVMSAEALASALAVQMQGRPSRAALKVAIEQLGERSPAAALIAGIGIWPEPNTLEQGVERASVYLARDAGAHLQVREDYNNPNTIPYFREAWYTPVRYANAHRCFWTLSYHDLLSKRDVVTCSMALGGTGNFLGVVTVSLDVGELAKYFATTTADASGYAVLLDRDNRVLALSTQAQATFGNNNRNAAELAQHNPSFNALALALDLESQKFVDTAVRSAQFDAASISALKDATRDMSRAEAGSALSTLWNAVDDRTPETQLKLSDDAILHGDGYAVLRTLPGTHWRIASITAAREGEEGSRYLISQALVLTLGAAMLTLALAWGAIRRTVVRPLQHMAKELAAYESNTEALAVALDESPSNEVGLLAHWYNERVLQLRGQIQNASIARSELMAEGAERRRVQEALVRTQERTNLALGSVEDGVISTDEKGLIDDMNPVAERLLGSSLQSAKGRPFQAEFSARLDDESAMPDIVKLAIERGVRIEYTGGVTLLNPRGQESPIAIVVIPLRARNGQDVGTIVVFRELVRTATLSQHHPAIGMQESPRESDRQSIVELVAPVVDEALQLRRVRHGLDDNRFHLTTQVISPSRRLADEGDVFEILLTLEDEEGFWSPPAAFLPAAENNGLGAALDRWVLGHTLDLLQSRPEIYGRLAFCSINLTSASLADPKLLDFLAEQFNQRPDVAINRLCFEMPRDAIIRQPQQSQKFCDAMRSFGYRVAADYHPGNHGIELDRLRALPIDFLKLDASQFPEIVSDPLQQVLAESALKVARQLNRRVIITGLDQAEWIDAWRNLGADYFQGYSLARPSPIPFARGG